MSRTPAPFRGLAALLVAAVVMGGNLEKEVLDRFDFQTLVQGLLHLVPKNLVAPFTSVDTPKLLFMAIILGLAIAVLGNRANGVATIFRQGNLIGMRLAEWIGRIIPYFSIAIAALMCLDPSFNRVKDLMALIYEIIYGVFASAANQFFVHMEMILQGRKMGLLNKDTLKEKISTR